MEINVVGKFESMSPWVEWQVLSLDKSEGVFGICVWDMRIFSPLFGQNDHEERSQSWEKIEDMRGDKGG